jgi:urease accessory protein
MLVNNANRLMVATLLWLVAPLALAHPGLHAGTGLVDGFMHPATGIDHLLGTLAAGFWAARGGDHGLRGQAFFIAFLAVGILLGITCSQLLHTDCTGLVRFALLAAVIAVAIGAPRVFWHVLFGSLALYHGVQHVSGLPADAAPAGYALGLVLATGVLLVVGQMLRHVVHTRRPHSA